MHLGAALALILVHGAAVQPGRSEASAGVSGASTATIRIPDAATEWPLQRAINGAHEWLESPACQEVFSDFTDLSALLSRRSWRNAR